MRILITGANGFLGRASLSLLPSTWDIVALTRTVNGSDTYPVTYHTPERMIACETAFDGVMHFAAQIQHPRNGPAGFLPSNVDLCSQLVQAYPDARHVLASSVSVYGQPGPQAITINTPCRPDQPYGLSKLAAECVIRHAEHHAVVRFSSLLGQGMYPQTFVPRIIADAHTHRRIMVMGTGARMQNYLDVRDAAAMCVAALKSTENFVSLGIAPRSWSNLDIAEMVASRLNAEIVLSGCDESPSHVYAMTGSVELGHNMRPISETLDWLVER